MSPSLHKRWFRVEESNGILRVAFADPAVAEEPASEAAASQLFALVARLRPAGLVVSLAGVRKLDSTMIGKLVALHLDLRPKGSRVVFCDIGPELGDVFTTLRLSRVLTLYG